MLRYSGCPLFDKATHAPNLDEWKVGREVGAFLLADANALLFGTLFDYLIPYERAWRAPLELHRRLKHLDPARLAQMDRDQLSPAIGRGSHGPALHRFPRVLARRLIAASRKLVADYGGTAANIWPDGSRAGDVLSRLVEFRGISQKLSRMLARLLPVYFGVRLTHWGDIDIAVDRHVARVFLRTGLIRRPPGPHSVAGVRSAVIARARQLRPRFPGCLDDPAFSIGLKWCAASSARCVTEPGEPNCPLEQVCRKKLDRTVS